jgi:hypothetical protein
MKHKILITLFSLGLMLSLGSFEGVLACICKEYKAQEVYNFADVVFIGKVVEGATEFKKREEGSYYPISAGITTFEVTEPFLGTQTGERVKIDGGAFGYCSFSVMFLEENEYVIYAAKNKDNTFVTSTCLRSKETVVPKIYPPSKRLSDSLQNNLKKDLQFLREELPKRKTATLTGKVMPTNDYDDKLYIDEIPFENVKITIKDLDNTRRIFFTKSDEKGNFIIELPEGKYKVEIETPKGRKLTKWAKEKLESIKLRTGGELSLYIDLEKVFK